MGLAQKPTPISEVRAILHEASVLIPRIEPYPSTLATNIATGLMRAGDLEAALAVLPVSVWDRDVGGVGYRLAEQGRLSTALDLVAATPDEQTRAREYWQVAQALLKGAKYDSALLVARLILKDPKRTEMFLGILMQIYTAQFKAGDQQSASASLSEALGVVQREPENAEGWSNRRPIAWVYEHRAKLYESIARALVLAGNQDGAVTVVALISAMAAEEQDFARKQAVLGQLSVAQADLGDFTAALRTADLLKSDIEHAIALEGIAIQQARQGNITAALAIADSPSGLMMRTLLTIERTLAHSGDYLGARAAIDRMKEPGERSDCLADLAFQQVDKDPEAAKLTVALAWKATQDSKGKVDSYVYQNAVEYIAATRARLGDVKGALEIINGPDPPDRLWPLQVLIQFMVGAGKKNDALALSRSQKSPRLRAYCLLRVAESLMDEIEEARISKVVP